MEDMPNLEICEQKLVHLLGKATKCHYLFCFL